MATYMEAMKHSFFGKLQIMYPYDPTSTTQSDSYRHVCTKNVTWHSRWIAIDYQWWFEYQVHGAKYIRTITK